MDFDQHFADSTNVLTKPDSSPGSTLIETDLPNTFNNASDNYAVGCSSSSLGPVDVEAITLEAILELAEDPLDLFSTEPIVESTAFDPMPAPVQSCSILKEINSRSYNDSRRMPKRILELPPNKFQRPTKKVKRIVSTSSESSGTGEVRFRGYQADQWAERFDELSEFYEKHGHCQVPHSYVENEALARWTKRQRYQYKLKIEGKPSTMTDDRVSKLDAIGFTWDSHSAVWEERLNELLEFRRVQGHCLVPSQHKPNQKLATWVKCQRRQYKLFVAKQRSNMTMPRIQKLEKLGFVWELRSHNN